MAEYIEKEKVTKICLKHYNDSFTDIPAHEAIYAVSTDIEKLPAADVVEVRHGYWKQNPYCKRIYYCSVCGRGIEDCTGNHNEHFPYCHCGAKMDGVKNNQNHG